MFFWPRRDGLTLTIFDFRRNKSSLKHHEPIAKYEFEIKSANDVSSEYEVGLKHTDL